MGDVLNGEFENSAKCEHRIWLVKCKWAIPKPVLQTERANTQDEKSCLSALFLLVMFLLTQKWCYAVHNDVARNARSDVMFAHYAVRRNIIHAVNITAEGNITCPQGQTSFSVNTPLRVSR